MGATKDCRQAKDDDDGDYGDDDNDDGDYGNDDNDGLISMSQTSKQKM